MYTLASMCVLMWHGWYVITCYHQVLQQTPKQLSLYNGLHCKLQGHPARRSGGWENLAF